MVYQPVGDCGLFDLGGLWSINLWGTVVYQPEGTVFYQPVEDCGASACGGLWSIDLDWGLWSINLWVTVLFY